MEDNTKPTLFARIVSSIIVDGSIQVLMTLWTLWIILAINGKNIDFFFWWLGSTTFIVACYFFNKSLSGIIVVNQIITLLIFTLYVWIMK